MLISDRVRERIEPKRWTLVRSPMPQVTRDQMFEPMLTACPSFAPAWVELCATWGEDRGDSPLYVAIGDLARHLIACLRSGVTAEFPAVFQVLERWHREGDPFVREAATVGLLEGLQNIAGHEGIDPRFFEQWLLPESRRWWDKLDGFWGGDPSALRDE